MFRDHLDGLFSIACHHLMSLMKLRKIVFGCTARERSESNDILFRSKPHTKIKRVMNRKASVANIAVNIKQAVVNSSIHNDGQQQFHFISGSHGRSINFTRRA